ncbi:MAG: transcriptional regulator [Actinomycetota bacterium]|jgi:DNA-binding MarR family transcriptional regulator|nr:transcriptional regulator [Actinomycetota bacterium]
MTGSRTDGAEVGRRQAQPAAGSGGSGAHPTSALDETVHQRHRLGILTITAEAASAEFGYLQDALGLTAGNLSRHLTVLQEAGLVEVMKGHQGRRPRTWVKITGTGRAALTAEIAALGELVRRHTAPGGSAAPPARETIADPGR